MPLAGLLLNIEAARLPLLLAAMLCGAPALVLLGGIGAALGRQRATRRPVDGAYRHAVLCAGIDFGAAAASQLALIRVAPPVWPYLGILAALSAAALLLAPFAIAAALRAAQD